MFSCRIEHFVTLYVSHMIIHFFLIMMQSHLPRSNDNTELMSEISEKEDNQQRYHLGQERPINDSQQSTMRLHQSSPSHKGMTRMF